MSQERILAWKKTEALTILQCQGKVNLKKQLNILECSFILLILTFLVKKKNSKTQTQTKQDFIKILERICLELKKKKLKKKTSLFI